MKKIYLSKADKKIAGVAGGIAERFEIDSSLVRLAIVFLGLATGLVPMLFTYILAWIIIPKKPIAHP